MLTITAYKPETPVGGKKYISARMSSRQSWTYGKFEMRAKLPAGRGVWPAFWMLPVTHSDDNLLDGEIDIMEYVGYEPGIVWFSVHNKKDRTEDGKNKLTTSYVLKAPETEFHVYGMEWTPVISRPTLMACLTTHSATTARAALRVGLSTRRST